MLMPGVMDVYGNMRFFNVPVKEDNLQETVFHTVYFSDSFPIDAVIVLDLETHKIKVYPKDRTRTSFNGGCFYDMDSGDGFNLSVSKNHEGSLDFDDFWRMKKR